MVAAWLKIATPVLKTLPASKKQRPHRQNVLSEHQNASTADATTGAWGILQEAQMSRIIVLSRNSKAKQANTMHPCKVFNPVGSAKPSLTLSGGTSKGRGTGDIQRTC
jgi:hypothetical protein